MIKAAQNTSKLAGHVRKATAEQAKSRQRDITQSMESMRRGAAATTRALTEQATREPIRSLKLGRAACTRQAAQTTRSHERSRRPQSAQIAGTIKPMRQESQQSAKALIEQTRTIRRN